LSAIGLGVGTVRIKLSIAVIFMASPIPAAC
jgi:hypothetical protein